MHDLPQRCLTANGPPLEIGVGPFLRAEVWYGYIDRDGRLKRRPRYFEGDRRPIGSRCHVLWHRDPVWTAGRWEHELVDTVWYEGTPWAKPMKKNKDGPPTIYRELFRYIPDAYAVIQRSADTEDSLVAEFLRKRWGIYQVKTDKFTAPSRPRQFPRGN